MGQFQISPLDAEEDLNALGFEELGAGGWAIVATEAEGPISRYGCNHSVRDHADPEVTASEI